MLPKEYRQRYIAFFVLSLLAHLAVVMYLIWNPIFDAEKQKATKTVEIKLKQTQKKQEKKATKKDAWEDVKKKKQEERKQQAKKKAQEKKKAAEKKEQSKEKQQPKEKKKEQPKKEEKKQAKEKQRDPLSEQHSVKKVENKTSQAQTQKASQPKSGEQKSKPKTQDKKVPGKSNEKTPAKGKQAAKPKKVETPKKEAPKQAKPQSAKEPSKTEKPKASKEPGTLRGKPTEQQKPPSEKKGIKQQTAKSTDNTKARDLIQKLGNMQVLDDRAMKKAVIATQGFGRQFKKRTVEGKAALDSLQREEKQEYFKYMQLGADKILENYNAPKKDGKKYHGEISILLDKNGFVESVSFKKPSGNYDLDSAMYSAVMKTPRLLMPDDPRIAYVMYIRPIILWYTEEDMAD